MSDPQRAEPKRGWLQRLSDGLSRSSRQMTEQVTGVFTKRPLDQAQLDELEEMLIEADLGPAAAARIAERVRRAALRPPGRRARGQGGAGRGRRRRADRRARATSIRWPGPRPFVVLFVGVNGSGKTTTLGKIAADLTGRGAKVLVAAGDTFRAAAVEQLEVWAERAGAGFVSRPARAPTPPGSPTTPWSRPRPRAYDVVLIDTAGRLQNKQDLMDELTKMVRVLRKLDPDAPHEVLLVLDATVGRNALAQENVFGNTDRRDRHRHDQARRHRARRRAGAGGPGLGLADQADRRRRGDRRPAAVRRRAPSRARWWGWSRERRRRAPGAAADQADRQRRAGGRPSWPCCWSPTTSARRPGC